MDKNLFSPYKLGNIELKNKIVMAPMTRCRAIGNIPNSLIAEYYQQRSDAGLIITEGTSPSINGLGYARIPGIFNQEQVSGWKLVSDAVHKKNGKIFIQIMHTGRVSHPANLPKGAKHIAPSAIKISGQMWTDSQGMQDYPTPQEMTIDEIKSTIQEYISSAQLAMEANLDGVELHAANGYLMEQFLNPKANQRKDSYGGSPENRNRFVIEVAKEVASKIGKEKVGIRLSPYGAACDLGEFDGIETQYSELAKELNSIGIVYIHIVDHSSMGAPPVPESIINTIKREFKGTIVLSGGYNFEKAQKDLNDSRGDLIGFGRPFISNPDLVKKLKNKEELKNPDPNSFYSADEKGYTDY